MLLNNKYIFSCIYQNIYLNFLRIASISTFQMVYILKHVQYDPPRLQVHFLTVCCLIPLLTQRGREFKEGCIISVKSMIMVPRMCTY